MEEIAKRASAAAKSLQTLSNKEKNKVLESIYLAIEANRKDIIKANEIDMQAASEAVASGELSTSLYARLDFQGKQGKKFKDTLQGIRNVIALDNPTDKITLSRELADGLKLYRVTCPIGVLLVIFEARPEVIVQITSLAIKSGNAVILKGGKEALHTQAALEKVMHEAIRNLSDTIKVPVDAIQFVSSRSEIGELLKMEKYIDLVVPRGSNALVRHIQHSTSIPVLGHADGICSIYVDKEAYAEKAAKVVLDAKTNYPAACNTVETVLIHETLLESSVLIAMAKSLVEAKVEIRADQKLIKVLSKHFPSAKIVLATTEDYSTEFLDLVVALKTVSSMEEAIHHIHEYGSKHTDCIITENEQTAIQFMRRIDSAGVYWNASTRFADGFRYGFGAEVGVSTNKTHARGPVGLEGLLIYKYLLIGNGHAVSSTQLNHKPTVIDPLLLNSFLQ